jgi:hypothetical protein
MPNKKKSITLNDKILSVKFRKKPNVSDLGAQ